MAKDKIRWWKLKDYRQIFWVFTLNFFVLIWLIHDENLKFEHPKTMTFLRQTNFQLAKKIDYNSSNCVTLN
jgi:hypothetical protein